MQCNLAKSELFQKPSTSAIKRETSTQANNEELLTTELGEKEIQQIIKKWKNRKSSGVDKKEKEIKI